MIERLVVVTEKDRIESPDLPNSVTGFISRTIPHPFLSENIPLKDALKKFESIIIEKTIQKYGSQHKAAKILKVDQATISRKMKKYKILQTNVILHK